MTTLKELSEKDKGNFVKKFIFNEGKIEKGDDNAELRKVLKDGFKLPDASFYRKKVENVHNEHEDLPVEEKEKKSSADIHNRVRYIMKDELNKRKASEDIEDYLAESKISRGTDVNHEVMKKVKNGLLGVFSKSVSKRVSVDEPNSQIGSIVTNLKRVGALDNGMRDQINNTIKQEHKMAISAYAKHLDSELPNRISKFISKGTNDFAKKEEEKFKDSLVTKEDGTLSQDPTKRINSKEISRSYVSNKNIDMMNDNTKRDKEEDEDRKVRNISSILGANRDQIILR